MTKEEAQTNIEWVVYELITRHFLACCSKNAVGSETNLTMKVKEE
jgi:DNA topoisomerase-3